MPDIHPLLTGLEQAFDRRSWHGTNLNGSVRGLTVDVAAWRPTPRRHNIWELVVHTAYWKYTVLRRLTGAERGSFPLTGSNWFARPLPDQGTPRDLAADVQLLRSTHRALLRAVQAFDLSRLDTRPPGGKVTYRDLIVGVAAHDLYHAGQIQLLKRLHAELAQPARTSSGRPRAARPRKDAS